MSWDLSFIIHLALALVIGLVVPLLSALAFPFALRRIWAFMSDRLGPNRVGPQGLLQAVADSLKLFIKEDITPSRSDWLLFTLAPAIAFITPVIAISLIPLSEGYTIANLNVGLVFVVAFGSFAVLGILLAGWSSYNKYSLLGGLRSVAQMISYEIPMILNIVIVAMLVGSLSLGDVVGAQGKVWYAAVQPLAFLIFIIAGMAELNRTPFDLPEAESELVGGYMTEYGGMRFGFFYGLIEWGNVTIWSLTGATLFLGGWHGPFAAGPAWLIIKVLILVFVVIWFFATFPRLQIDQLMNFAWKVLIPISLVNLAVTAALILLLPDNFLPPVAAFSWVSLISLVVLFPPVLRKVLLWKRMPGKAQGGTA